ncbi:MAG TPA: hypothetical protein VK689_15845, partial [Armatimonadota bacterium]|nr:hypothetical protein [Armatimonadota bacterium]
MPLSNTEIITRLNRYFVPVYLANEDYREGGSAPAEEKAELRRIHAEGHAAKLSVGTVHAYVLAPDGRLLDSMHVAEAFKVQKLLAMLDRTVEKLATQPGDPVVKPAPQSAAKAEPGCLLLHVTARYLERKGDEYALVENAGGNWSAFPGEAWITLERAEWAKLLPPAAARVGDSWEIDRQTAARILNHFYPPTENNDLGKNRIQEQSLKGTVISVRDGIARARIDGGLKMKHPFYHKDDDKSVE